MSRLLPDLVLCAWFVLVAVFFWAPHTGVSLPVGPATALYGLFLLIFIAALALRLLRGASANGIAEETPISQPQERKSRRGERND